MFRIRREYDLDLVREMQAYELMPMDESELQRTEWWAGLADVQRVAVAGFDPTTRCLNACFVLKQWRGQGLQKRLIRTRVAHARRVGFVDVWTYTWVENQRSMRNLITCGFLPAGRYESADTSTTYLRFERVL